MKPHCLMIILGILTVCLPGCCTEEPIEPVTRVVRIDGMHCEACETSIEESVTVLQGVHVCEASFEKGNAMITADDAAAMERAVDRIRQMQFTVLAPDRE